MHIVDNHQLLQLPVAEFLLFKGFRNDPHNPGPVLESSVGEEAHEADIPAAVDQPKAAPSNSCAQGDRGVLVGRAGA